MIIRDPIKDAAGTSNQAKAQFQDHFQMLNNNVTADILCPLIYIQEEIESWFLSVQLSINVVIGTGFSLG